jgi:hypothetical protein
LRGFVRLELADRFVVADLLLISRVADLPAMPTSSNDLLGTFDVAVAKRHARHRRRDRRATTLAIDLAVAERPRSPSIASVAERPRSPSIASGC